MQYSKNKYAFALTGKTWALIKQFYPELIPKVVTRGAIFARMSPDQKQQLVQELQSLGYYVGRQKSFFKAQSVTLIDVNKLLREAIDKISEMTHR